MCRSTLSSSTPRCSTFAIAISIRLSAALFCAVIAPIASAQSVAPPTEQKSAEVQPAPPTSADMPAPPQSGEAGPTPQPTEATPPATTQTPTASPEAAAAAAVQAVPQSALPAPVTDEAAFTLFRHDLINLLILRADGRTLAAAAQIAAPDRDDPSRSAIKKTPGLLKRAQQFGGQDPLVLWVAASNACLAKPGCADPAALKALQTVDADNAAVWLLSFPADDNAARARATVARMAQTQRYDDYWGANVVALFHALEILSVPQAVLRQGVGVDAARINFATSIASSLLPVQLKQLVAFCRAAAGKDDALVGDCIGVARKLEAGGTFISQKVGFAIEDVLVPAGVNRDVMLSRQRSAVWQQEKFLEISARFTRDPAVAQAYVRLLGSEQNGLAAALALLHEQGFHADPPPGWQAPGAPAAADPLQALPATQH